MKNLAEIHLADRKKLMIEESRHYIWLQLWDKDGELLDVRKLRFKDGLLVLE